MPDRDGGVMVAVTRPPAAGASPPRTLSAQAPGRVNLIGDHTDYNDGVALPMAIDLRTEVTFTENDSDRLLLYSAIDPAPVSIPLGLAADPSAIGAVQPAWGRLAAAVAALAAPGRGGVGRLSSSLPAGAGLSSSAAMAVALALALGSRGTPLATARLCQQAEALVGNEVGLLDPLAIAAGEADHALVIEFGRVSVTPVALPADLEVVVVHSGLSRELAHTPYAARRAECAAAALELGSPLGKAEMADVTGMIDPVLRRRTRHVVTECQRVRQFAEALRSDDMELVGALMAEGQHSLSADFEVSTPEVDALVEAIVRRPGVHGARMTGGGFGGCVVALTEPGAYAPATWPEQCWVVRASDGASVSARTSGRST
jgi:galactokinase